MSFSRCTPLALLCALAAGCLVMLEDLPGRACDDTHPCRTGRVCEANRCVDRPDGGMDGSVDAGLDAGLDAGALDAGFPLWQQRMDGFDSVTEGSGCFTDIDPSRGNRLIATVQTSQSAEDFATGNVTDLTHLPAGFDGRLRGRISLQLAFEARGVMPLISLADDAARSLIEIGFTPQGRLYVLSEANTVADQPLFEAFERDGGFPSGDFVIEVAWRRGGTRDVFLDGTRLASTALGAASSTAAPAALRLGVLSTGQLGGGPFSLTMSGFQLADSPTVPLGDVP